MHADGFVLYIRVAVQLTAPCSHCLEFIFTMSDSEGDFSDELLELAGASEKKRKKRQAAASKSSKRRKPE